jgi:hypothetical protein
MSTAVLSASMARWEHRLRTRGLKSLSSSSLDTGGEASALRGRVSVRSSSAVDVREAWRGEEWEG